MENKAEVIINKTVEKIAENYKSEELLLCEKGRRLPSRDAVIEVIKDLQKVIFPGYFSDESVNSEFSGYFVGNNITRIFQNLKKQIELSMLYKNLDNLCAKRISEKAEEVCISFFEKLPDIQNMLLKDVQAGFDGDPAAKSKEEIIFSYPGFFAIYVYRIAHTLYENNIAFIPRIMTEYAHSQTGIDINSGATIGEYFFIDHGTGVVVGETCNIGNNVKIYQGVTLGALSTRKGQELSGVKRHPTIESNVTIYSGATILGGETVIGEHTIIGGNSFITESVPAYTKVSIKNPELIIKEHSSSKQTWEI